MKIGGVSTINKEVQRIVNEIEDIECYSLENFATLKKKNLNKMIGYFLLYLVSFWKIIFYKPDVVYLQISQTGYFHQSIFLLIAKIFGRKTIAHFHAKPDVLNNRKYISKQLIILSQLYVDKLIVLTEKCKRNLIENGWKRNIFVIPNFIDISNYPTVIKPVKKRLNILYVGRMTKEKGIFEVLKIANLLKEFKFVFVGGFSDTKQEREFKAKLQFFNNVEWIGAVYDDKKIDYIMNSIVLLMPTKWVGEVFPLTLIECSICGVIPFTCPIGSIPDIIKDGYNGFYIEADRPHETAKKLKGILNDYEELERISTNCRENTLRKYTSNIVKSKLLKIILR